MEESNQKEMRQQNLIKELTSENEQLYQQFNHQMIRNHQMLKRINDQQQIINDLHIRIEELNLINNNLLRVTDHVRAGYDNRNTATSLLRSQQGEIADDNELKGIELEELYQKWKSYPGQEAKNAPNLRKQILMLALLYSNKSLKASDLFYKSGIGAVTGARYVATLKKYGLIQYTGARKKGHYIITPKGKDFIELKTLHDTADTSDKFSTLNPNTLYEGIPLNEEIKIPTTNTLDHFDL